MNLIVTVLLLKSEIINEYIPDFSELQLMFKLFSPALISIVSFKCNLPNTSIIVMLMLLFSLVLITNFEYSLLDFVTILFFYFLMFHH